MTFDLERYRAHITPLQLTPEKEDELLRDLWCITEALVDQSFSSPFYPLQMAVAQEAIDSLEKSIALESQYSPKAKAEANPDLQQNCKGRNT